MPRAATRRSAGPPPLSASAQLIGLSAYAMCLLLGFGFGLWAGSRPPRTTEVAQADAPPSPADVKPAETRPAEPPPAAKAPEKSAPNAPPKKAEPKPEPSKKDASRPPGAKRPEPKPAPPPAPAANVTFAKDIVPVFRTYCLSCHSGQKPKGGVDLSSMAAITKGKRGKPIFRPGDPAASSLYTSVEDGTMPPEGKAPSEVEKRLIRDWILGGAK